MRRICAGFTANLEIALELFIATTALTFYDGWNGRLTPGFVADFAVLSNDSTTFPPAQL